MSLATEQDKEKLRGLGSLPLVHSFYQLVPSTSFPKHGSSAAKYPSQGIDQMPHNGRSRSSCAAWSFLSPSALKYYCLETLLRGVGMHFALWRCNVQCFESEAYKTCCTNFQIGDRPGIPVPTVPKASPLVDLSCVAQVLTSTSRQAIRNQQKPASKRLNM
jgi:hypothetical protein